MSSVRCEDEDLDTRVPWLFILYPSSFIIHHFASLEEESLWQAPSSRIERVLQALQALKRGVP